MNVYFADLISSSKKGRRESITKGNWWNKLPNGNREGFYGIMTIFRNGHCKFSCVSIKRINTRYITLYINGKYDVEIEFNETNKKIKVVLKPKENKLGPFDLEQIFHGSLYKLRSNFSFLGMSLKKENYLERCLISNLMDYLFFDTKK
jgi:hypothetical protein